MFILNTVFWMECFGLMSWWIELRIWVWMLLLELLEYLRSDFDWIVVQE